MRGAHALGVMVMVMVMVMIQNIVSRMMNTP